MEERASISVGNTFRGEIGRGCRGISMNGFEAEPVSDDPSAAERTLKPVPNAPLL